MNDFTDKTNIVTQENLIELLKALPEGGEITVEFPREDIKDEV